MAKLDIMPVVSNQGGHHKVLHFRMGALTTNDTEDTSWRQGELLQLDAAVGDINPATDGTYDPATGLIFLAAAGSKQLIEINGSTSGATTHDLSVPGYDFTQLDVEWKTRNIFNNSDTNVGPGGTGAMTGAVVGADADLWVDDATSATNHRFGLDLNGDYFIITRILDAAGVDTFMSGATPYVVYFKRKV